MGKIARKKKEIIQGELWLYMDILKHNKTPLKRALCVLYGEIESLRIEMEDLIRKEYKKWIGKTSK